jgi:hypothetical protein
MVWGCISHDCKLDLVTIQGNLTGDQYIRDVLQPVVVSHFDNQPLTTRPVYMDDNTRRLSSDQWMLRHVLKFQPYRAKHHAKRDRRCRSANSCERLAKIRKTTGNI